MLAMPCLPCFNKCYSMHFNALDPWLIELSCVASVVHVGCNGQEPVQNTTALAEERTSQSTEERQSVLSGEKMSEVLSEVKHFSRLLFMGEMVKWVKLFVLKLVLVQAFSTGNFFGNNFFDHSLAFSFCLVNKRTSWSLLFASFQVPDHVVLWLWSLDGAYALRFFPVGGLLQVHGGRPGLSDDSITKQSSAVICSDALVFRASKDFIVPNCFKCYPLCKHL